MSVNSTGMFGNRFEVCTRGNYNIATEFFKYHLDMLFNDSTTSPIALTCYNNVKSKYDNFKLIHDLGLSQEAIQGGDVDSFALMLKGMPSHVDDWEAKIKAVYAKNTSKFRTFFPKGKEGFNSGKQQKRVDAVSALITTIGTDASLAAVKTLVQTFYTSLLAAFNTKDSAKKATTTDSIALEDARLDICDEIEGNYGLLIAANKKTPIVAAKYFLEALMTNSIQMSFNLKVKPLFSKNAIKRTFPNPLTQQFQIINNTNTTAHVFLSVTKLGVIGLVYVIVPPLSDDKYFLKDIGDNVTAKFLKVYNTDDKIKADLTIKVL